jgi:hypothetical protein
MTAGAPPSAEVFRFVLIEAKPAIVYLLDRHRAA